MCFFKISLKKNAIILCDDYEDADYITGVKRAVDQFVKEKKLKFEIIEKRFAKKVKISAGMSKELFTCCKTYFYIEKSEQILVLECFDY